MRSVVRLPRSLRGKLIAIVIAGVLVPVALVSIWTTRRLAQAGHDLLRSQLEASTAELERVIERNWNLPRGNLMLLAGNQAIQAALRSSAAAFTAEDEHFLIDVFTLVRPVVDEVVYSDRSGVPRWQIGPDPALEIRVERAAAVSRPPSSRLGALAVDFPIEDEESGTTTGTMTALVRLNALVTAGALTPATATIDFLDSRDGVSLLRREASDQAADLERLSVERRVRAVPLEISASAPVAPYVRPFEESARRGLILFAIVLLGAWVAAGFLAMRATRSLAALANAADAVARGDLGFQVAVRSEDEIGRVATAFNSMTQDLRRMLREASQRDALAAIGEFAAELAHEVRNPLTSIRLDLQRMQERLVDPKSRDVFARVLAVVDRLNRTVTGTLRVARSGNIKLEPVQLAAALEPAIQAASPVFSARDISLEHDLGDASATWMLGDIDALAQLFTNLLFNAAEAIEHSGRVGISAQQQNGSVMIRIADSGPGMSPEVLRQLQDPLRTTKREGTGLGLTIARRIAAAHGGSIEFDSSPGSGTVAVITFPRQDTADLLHARRV